LRPKGNLLIVEIIDRFRLLLASKHPLHRLVARHSLHRQQCISAENGRAADHRLNLPRIKLRGRLVRSDQALRQALRFG
jgi:sugar lactone lactonase YvrE